MKLNNRLAVLKELYGYQITLIGNVAASDTLSYGTIKETIALTKQCLKDAAEGGGYILAPGSDVITSVKPQNILAMIQTANQYGLYPINRDLL